MITIIEALMFSFFFILIIYVIAAFSSMRFWPSDELSKEMAWYFFRLIFIIMFLVGIILSLTGWK